MQPNNSPKTENITSKYSYEIGPIRPPNEGRESSLLIRITRNCPWNRCEFCPTYKDRKFEHRSLQEVKEDINNIKRIADELKEVSWKAGYGGTINDAVIAEFIRVHPEVYGRKGVNSELLHSNLHCLMNVANWLASGGSTVFLQDADSLIIRTSELIEILGHLKNLFPSVRRVTSYARAKTLYRKSLDDLIALHHAGLTRVHVGLESGCDEVLAYVQKGVTAAEHIEAGTKVIRAGIELSEYVMPGLGGQKLSEKHVRDTADVLNRIGPHFIRLRSLIIKRNTPLYDKWQKGEFIPVSDDGLVTEIRLLIELLNCHSYLTSDHISNLLIEIEGQLPDEKSQLIQTISRYQSLPDNERLKFQLRRRLRSYTQIHGGLSDEIEGRVHTLLDGVDKGTQDVRIEINNILNQLKESFI